MGWGVGGVGGVGVGWGVGWGGVGGVGWGGVAAGWGGRGGAGGGAAGRGGAQRWHAHKLLHTDRKPKTPKR